MPAFRTLIIVALASAALAPGSSAATTEPSPPPAKLLGQRIMVGLTGTSPDAALLSEVRRGAVGAVLLFAYNIVDRPQIDGLTAALQHAAHQGANPPLLIATDQEGGQVRRFDQGPPFLTPTQMGSLGSSSVARRQGAITGGYLKSRGVNLDLAPVLDIPTFSQSFIWQQGRAFSFSPSMVSNVGGAFALGVQSAGVAATGKHFPGLGSAPLDTDNVRQELRPTAVELRQALEPYQAAIPQGLDAVMLSTAGFPAYDPSGNVAAMSSPIINGLLRGQLKFRGVTITDALSSPTGYGEVTGGVRAAEAGADILLYTDAAPGELTALEAAYRGGHISRTAALASYQRIVALKRKVG